MIMKVAIAAAWLGLMVWAGPAGADSVRTFSLTVGHHKSIHLSGDQVDKILAAASTALKKCNVVLKRKGPVGTFASSKTPSKIKDATDRDTVHRENFDIKVVDLPIDFCRVSQMHEGCAWDPPPPPAKQVPRHRSMILSDIANAEMAGIIWAHEFGHRTGLPHRSGDRNALMSCQVPIQVKQPDLNDHECKCFRGGPGSCDDPIETAQLCSVR